MVEPKLLSYRFVIDERPMCIWGWDLGKQNLQFIQNIDPSHFSYLAKVHFLRLQIHQLGGIYRWITKFIERKIFKNDTESNDDAQDAALAIRSAYSQGLEMLFAYIGATLQAPMGVVGWVTKYRNQELRQLISKIDKGNQIKSFFSMPSISWHRVSELIHRNLVLDDKTKEDQIKLFYGDLLKNFASDYLNDEYQLEYNSIKHGLRVKKGGFYLRIGREETHGVPALKEKMTTVGNSDFGSSYYVLKKIEGKYNFSPQNIKRNWNPEDMVYGLKLISSLLNNVLSFLMILNGVDPKEISFKWPREEETYNKPWTQIKTLGVTGMTVTNPIPDELVTEYSEEEIFKVYQVEKEN